MSCVFRKRSHLMIIGRIPSFPEKKPNLQASRKDAYGNNIYHVDHAGQWQQRDSHHSHPGGEPNQDNLRDDTSVDRVLVAEDYCYWGGNGPRIESRFQDICVGRGYKCNFPPEFVDRFVEWYSNYENRGYCGEPLEWRWA